MNLKHLAPWLCGVALLGAAFQAHANTVTVNYMCTDKKPLAVTYHFGEAKLTARMKVDAIERLLTLDNHNEDKTLDIFTGEEHQMLTDPINVNNVRRVTVTSISNEVQEVRYENCRPVARGRAR